MKKEYTKPELDSKAFAQFENVFTACSKGNDHSVHKGKLCIPDTYDYPNSGLEFSAAYSNQKGVS